MKNRIGYPYVQRVAAPSPLPRGFGTCIRIIEYENEWGHKIDPDKFDYGLRIYQAIRLVLKPDFARTKKGSTVTIRTTTTIHQGYAGGCCH